MGSLQSFGQVARQKQSAILLCLVLTLFATAYTWWQLDQLQQGRLFLFQLSGEKPASSYELFDAKQSATQFMLPAILCVILLGGLTMFVLIRWDQLIFRRSKLWNILAAVLYITAMLDLATTINFFHKEGIHPEIHPGIRLFGYAYGRTIGPVLGKTIQVIGIVCLSRQLGRTGALLMAVVAVSYFAAGIYNLLQV